jgi:hypothetical protein
LIEIGRTDGQWVSVSVQISCEEDEAKSNGNAKTAVGCVVIIAPQTSRAAAMKHIYLVA